MCVQVPISGFSSGAICCAFEASVLYDMRAIGGVISHFPQKELQYLRAVNDVLSEHLVGWILHVSSVSSSVDHWVAIRYLSSGGALFLDSLQSLDNGQTLTPIQTLQEVLAANSSKEQVIALQLQKIRMIWSKQVMMVTRVMPTSKLRAFLTLARSSMQKSNFSAKQNAAWQNEVNLASSSGGTPTIGKIAKSGGKFQMSITRVGGYVSGFGIFYAGDYWISGPVYCNLDIFDTIEKLAIETFQNLSKSKLQKKQP
jgi:hypothetical protein